MSIIKNAGANSQVTYNVGIEELRILIANDLEVDISQVSIEQDTKFVGYGTIERPVFAGLKITVNGKEQG